MSYNYIDNISCFVWLIFTNLVITLTNEQWSNRLPDRQTILLSKLKITLIVRGYSHHGTSAIIIEHVVGNENRDAFFGEWVLGQDTF